MKIRAGFKIGFEVQVTTPLLLMLNIRPEREPDLLSAQTLNIDPPTPARRYRDQFGNICNRVRLSPGVTTFSSDFLISDSGEAEPTLPEAGQPRIEDLPDDVLVYLLASRYCESDLLADRAWSLFSGVKPGWPRVQAIVDYAHDRLKFDYMAARPTRTALQADQDRTGVCRDFAHLAVALCRSMNIPARYCTGYLGDIGVPPLDSPMDFSAWFEVYLEGGWRAFDARHNQPRIGRILMAVGRDAADVAFSTAFGQATLRHFEVITEEVEG